jgi:hypothetical protein
MSPTVSPSAGCLSRRIPRAAAGKSREQLVSLEHPSRIGVPLSACFSDPKMWKSEWESSGLCAGCSSTSQRMCCTLVLMVFTTWGRALSCKTSTAVFDTQALPYTGCIRRWISDGWQPSASKNWITSRWSCLNGRGMWYALFSRLSHVTPLNSSTNACNATNWCFILHF